MKKYLVFILLISSIFAQDKIQIYDGFIPQLGSYYQKNGTIYQQYEDYFPVYGNYLNKEGNRFQEYVNYNPDYGNFYMKEGNRFQKYKNYVPDYGKYLQKEGYKFKHKDNYVPDFNDYYLQEDNTYQSGNELNQFLDNMPSWLLQLGQMKQHKKESEAQQQIQREILELKKQEARLYNEMYRDYLNDCKMFDDLVNEYNSLDDSSRSLKYDLYKEKFYIYDLLFNAYDKFFKHYE